MIIFENAAGGIILTASHNPKEWNALKLLNAKGEFISRKDGEAVLDLQDNAVVQRVALRRPVEPDRQHGAGLFDCEQPGLVCWCS